MTLALDYVNDMDGHEMTPAHHLEEMLGEPGRILAKIIKMRDEGSAAGPMAAWAPELEDTAPITYENVWGGKGVASPGAFDLTRRAEVLDFMGVKTQMLYPTTPITAIIVGDVSEANLAKRYRITDSSVFEGRTRQQLMREIVDAYNGWIVDHLDADGDRLVRVGLLPTSIPRDELLHEAKRLVSSGVRAVWIPVGKPPAGLSPAAEELDEFWSLFADNDVAVTSHIGSEIEFLDQAWADSPRFGTLFDSIELPFSTVHLLSTIHFAVENYVTTMVLGGVFERNPNLRFGISELGAYWVGPMAERLDLYSHMFRGMWKGRPKPSDLVAEHIKVSPFNHENIASYFERYPNLSDVFCYGSDYPHVEGGKDSKEAIRAQLEHLGPEVVEKFFVTNAQAIVGARGSAKAAM